MSVLNPKEDAAALQPILEATVKTAVEDAMTTLVPASEQAFQNALDGLTVTITLTVVWRTRAE
jgi:hypothetical protein